MKKLFCLLSALVALGIARAADENYTINLDTAQAGGGSRTGSGSGTMTLHANNTANYLLAYSGLPSARTVVGIYGPASPGNSASLLYVLASPFQPGGGNETIAGTFSLVAGRGGFTVAQQRSQLNLGLWYVGVSTAEYPATADMDLRGQIYNVIPEPGTFSLLALGAAGMALRLRKK